MRKFSDKSSLTLDKLAFVFVLLSMLEPKQIKYLTGLKITWFYPHYGVLAIIAIAMVGVKGSSISFTKRSLNILAISFFFSVVYTSSCFFNLHSSAEPFFSVQGLSRILIQYLFLLFTVLILLQNYQRLSFAFLRYNLVLSLVNTVFVLIGVTGFLTDLNLLPVQELVNSQILSQSWVRVANIRGFLPKFGGFFPETQAMALHLFGSYIAYKTLREHKINLAGFVDFYGRIIPLLIVLTFAKTVIPALAFYLVWSYCPEKRFKSLIIRALLTLLLFTLFFFLMLKPYSESLENIQASGLEADSIGERLFHISIFFQNIGNRTTSFLLGIGPYNYGSYVERLYPWRFNKYSNAVSIFTVFIESGLIGFILYLALWTYLILSAKKRSTKISLVSLFLANIGQPNWSMDTLLIFAITVYSIDLLSSQRENLVMQKSTARFL